MTQFEYSVCTVLMVSFGGLLFLRMVYNYLRYYLKCIYNDKNQIRYHCEMFSFNWRVNTTFVRALTRRMTSQIYTMQYSIRNLICVDLLFYDLGWLLVSVFSYAVFGNEIKYKFGI